MRARTMLMSGGLCLALSLAIIGCGGAETASPSVTPLAASPTVRATSTRSAAPPAELDEDLFSTPIPPTPTVIPSPTLRPIPQPPSPPSTFAGSLPSAAVARLGYGQLGAVRPSPDGRFLAVGGSIGVKVFGTDSYRPLWFAASDRITLLKWSPNSSKLAGGTGMGTILVWDGQSGQVIYTLTAHHDRVTSLDWAPNSMRLLSSSRAGTAIIWDFTTDTPPIALIRTDGLSSYDMHGFNWMSGQLSPDGRLYATIYEIGGGDAYSSDRVIIIWDAVTGVQYRILQGEQVSEIAWLPDSTHLLAATAYGGQLQLWNAATGELLRTMLPAQDWYSSPVPYLSPRGDLVALVARYHEPESVISVENGEVLYELPTSERPSDWIFEGEELVLYDSENYQTVFRDAASGAELRRLDGMAPAAFSPDWRTIYAWSGVIGERLVVADAMTGRSQLTLLTESPPIYQVAWSPDGTRIATGVIPQQPLAGEAILWDAQSTASLKVLNSTPPEAYNGRGFIEVAWSPDGSRLAVGSSPVTVWDAASGEPAGALDASDVQALTWSPDGGQIAVGLVTGRIRLFDAETGTFLLNYQAHSRTDSGDPPIITAMAWSPDASLLASAAYRQPIVLSDPDTAALVATIEDPLVPWEYMYTGLAFSPDGRFIAAALSANDEAVGHVVVWNVATRQIALRLTGPASYATGVDWSPDGRFIAASFGDPYPFSPYGLGPWRQEPGLVALWDAETGNTVATFEGHTDSVQSIAFSPDGSRLASASLDGTVLIWDVP